MINSTNCKFKINVHIDILINRLWIFIEIHVFMNTTEKVRLRVRLFDIIFYAFFPFRSNGIKMSCINTQTALGVFEKADKR